MKMPFSHSLMKGFLEGFLVIILFRRLIILSISVVSSNRTSIMTRADRRLHYQVVHLNFLSITGSEIILDSIYIRLDEFKVCHPFVSCYATEDNAESDTLAMAEPSCGYPLPICNIGHIRRNLLLRT